MLKQQDEERKLYREQIVKESEETISRLKKNYEVEIGEMKLNYEQLL